jgi:hypothetical protein
MAETKIKAAQFHGVVGHGTDGYFLMTNADGSMSWEAAGSPSPTIASVSYPGDDLAADPDGDQTVTITGTNFASGATVTVGGTAASIVSFVSATELTFTTPAKTAGDYDIVVTNTDGGTATSVNGISYNGIPSWTTATGSLGTFASDTTISTITLQASEPDAGTITFSITNGALPTGLSLTGADIDGTTSIESADTLYNFTVTATDDENQSTGRAFSITVEKYIVPAPENFEIVTYTGNGGTQAITSKIGKAASFNGSDSRINTNDNKAFVADEMSVSLWASLATTGTAEYLISNWNSSGTRETSFIFQLESNGKLRIIIYASNDSSNYKLYDSSSAITGLTDWNHFAFTLTSGITAKLYVNGSEVTTTVTNGATYSSGTINTTGTFDTIIGAIGNSGTAIDGKIDQVRIFNKALSSSEVTTLYGESNTSTTKSTTDIFGDGSGVALYELDEDAKDTGVYPLGQGAIDSGQSAFFGGNNDRVTASNFSSVLGTNRAFTISGWFFPSSISNNLDAITAWSTTGTTAANFVLGRHSGGTWQYRLGHANSNEIKVIFSDAYEVDKWVHVAFTYDGSKDESGVTLYLNGVAATVSSINDNNLTTNTDYPNFAIGYGAWNGDYYNGYVDQVRIYSSELSSSEVSDLANETNVPTSTLVAHYKLDGNANDETTNYNGSASGVTYSDPAEFPLIAYNGTPSNVNFLGMAFQPDLIWQKSRSVDNHHVLTDSVRGRYSQIFSHNTSAESTSTSRVQSFDANGFTIGNDSRTNTNNDDYVAWCWKAGGTVSANNNTDGDITSTVSANQDAGFSIVKYTGNSSTNQTIGHGLSSTPELIIIKNLDDGTASWLVAGENINLYLNLNRDVADPSSSSYNWITNRGADTFTVGSQRKEMNQPNEDFIAYCFHSVDDYQKIGSYSGNSSTNGPTITTGFRPRFLLVKRVDVANDWLIFDSVRSPSNPLDDFLRANTEGNEAVNSDKDVDFLDDGFQMVNNQAALNASGTNNYIYLAIA